MNHVPHLLPGAFLVPVQRSLRFVPRLESLAPRDQIFEGAGVHRGLRVGYSPPVLLTLLQDQTDVHTVDPRDLSSLRVHLTVESPVDDQTAKVREGPDVTEEVVEFLAKHVVQPADPVRGTHRQMKRKVAYT